MTREDVVANYRRSAPSRRANPGLIRKNYLYDALYDAEPSRGRRLSVAHDGRGAARAECGAARTGPDQLRQRAGRAAFRDTHGGGHALGKTIDGEG